MIYYGESSFQNQFELISSVSPESIQTYTGAGKNRDELIETTITNRVENDIYILTEQIITVLQPKDVLISIENSVTRIDVNTGILLEYDYKMSDANGNVVDSSSIRNTHWNQDDEVLDLGIFENLVVILVIFITIVALITIYYKTRR